MGRKDVLGGYLLAIAKDVEAEGFTKSFAVEYFPRWLAFVKAEYAIGVTWANLSPEEGNQAKRGIERALQRLVENGALVRRGEYRQQERPKYVLSYERDGRTIESTIPTAPQGVMVYRYFLPQYR